MKTFAYLKQFENRFIEALEKLCIKRPPTQLVLDWLENKNDDLQEWVLNNSIFEWAQGIGIIDAAHAIASQPKEGTGLSTEYIPEVKELDKYNVIYLLNNIRDFNPIDMVLYLEFNDLYTARVSERERIQIINQAKEGLINIGPFKRCQLRDFDIHGNMEFNVGRLETNRTEETFEQKITPDGYGAVSYGCLTPERSIASYLCLRTVHKNYSFYLGSSDACFGDYYDRKSRT